MQHWSWIALDCPFYSEGKSIVGQRIDKYPYEILFVPPSSDINYNSYQGQNACVANVDEMQAEVCNSVPLGEVDTIIILYKNMEYY